MRPNLRQSYPFSTETPTPTLLYFTSTPSRPQASQGVPDQSHWTPANVNRPQKNPVDLSWSQRPLKFSADLKFDLSYKFISRPWTGQAMKLIRRCRTRAKI